MPAHRGPQGSIRPPAQKRSSEVLVAHRPLDPQRAYEWFAPMAFALTDAEVLPYRGAATQAQAVVLRAVTQVLSELSRLRKELPTLDLTQLEALPDLAAALVFVVGHLDRSPHSRIGSVVAIGRSQSGTMRKLPRLPSTLGPGGSRTAGSTPPDAPRAAHWSCISQTVSGIQSLAALSEASSRRIPLDEQADRFWTLLIRGYENLWRTAVWLWGYGALRRVPHELPCEQPVSRRAREAINH